jgi:hypothetical protein
MLVVHTTSPCDRSLIPYRISDSSIFVCKTSKCRIPTPSDPLTRVPPIERLRPCREIADRDFIVQEFHDSGNSDMPNPDSSGSSDTRPQMNGSDLVGKSRIAISCCTISLPSKTPMPPNTDSLGSHATRPRRWTVHNSHRDIANRDSIMRVFLALENPDIPIPRLADSWPPLRLCPPPLL